ncbi:MAG: VWA domain-containing protein [Deltaproteobacteria bacterium]|nr:VWA domain-containing protein [Deltaproteobacteria bacterium]
MKNKKLANLVIFICLFVFAGIAGADYVTLGGKPVTQGQMLIAANSMDRLKSSSVQPVNTDRFILEKTNVDVEITGVIARVRVQQLFTNPFNDRLETTYVFPLPENAAVDAYSFKIGEKVIKGVVKEKEEARKEYEQARNDGRKAGLLEQERPDIFTQSLVNIPPGASVTANIEYVHTLKIDGAHYLFSFPMVVAPRYIPGNQVSRNNVGRGWANDTDQVPDASRITPVTVPPGMRTGNDVEITVKVDAGMPVTNITGVTHELDIVNSFETTAVVKLKNGPVIPNKDFILEYRVGGDSTMLAFMTHRSGSDDGYFSMVIQPKHNVEIKEVSPREVILLLDTSGSMQGVPLNQLKLFSEQVLATLNPQDYFNICAFSSSLKKLAQDSIAATESNINMGSNFIYNLQSNGGTEMLPAIKEILRPDSRELNLHRYVIIVTDALVGNDKTILNYLSKPEYSHLRVYPVAMGPAPNNFLIERAAEIGRGFSMRVTNQDNAAEMAKRLTSKISYPIMTDLAIDWGNLKVKDILPSPLPDLYADRPLIIIGRYEKPGVSDVHLKGNILGQKMETEFKVDLPEEQKDHDSLPVLWARARVRHLINAEIGNVSSETRNAVKDIGLKYQIVTDYTSFIAVERDIPENISSKLITQDVLTAIPEGMEHLFDGKGKASGQYIQPKNNSTVQPDRRDIQQTPSNRVVASSRPSSGYYSGSRSGSSGGGGSVGILSIIFAPFLMLVRFLERRRNRKKNFSHNL